MPLLVTNLIWAAPCPLESAPPAEVVTVSSSSESTVGIDVAEETVARLQHVVLRVHAVDGDVQRAAGQAVDGGAARIAGVCTPGWVTSSSTALRVAKGSSKIWRPLMVLLTAALVACTISAPADDLHDFVRRADFQLDVDGRRNAGVDHHAFHVGDAEAGLGDRHLVRRGLQRRDGEFALLVGSCFYLEAVAGLETMTSAAGTAAPVGSVTVPSMRAVLT